MSSRSFKRNYDAIQAFLRTHPVVRARDLRALGMLSCDFRQHVRRGWFRRVGRGLYVHRRATPGEYQALQMAALRTPHGTFCGETTLHLHGLVEARPETIWLGLRAKARRPRIDDPAVRVVWLTGVFERLPVETIEIEGVAITALTAAAAVAHAFARPDLVHQDVSVGALRVLLERDPLQEPVVVRLALRCRVLRVVWPHLPRRAVRDDAVCSLIERYPPPPLIITLPDTTVPPTTLPDDVYWPAA
jgi:hypothetical protein